MRSSTVGGFTLVVVIVALFVVCEALPPPPPPWPKQFVTTEVQYWAQEGNGKQVSKWWYDFPNARHRIDHTTVRELFPPVAKNSSEWWIENDLYIYDFDTNTCEHLDMGFGIPKPDWFLTDSNVTGTQWLLRDDAFHEVVQVAKEAPYSPFYYHALRVGGGPFRIVSPGPIGLIVVNELVGFTAAVPDPKLFIRPTITCKGVVLRKEHVRRSPSVFYASLTHNLNFVE